MAADLTAAEFATLRAAPGKFVVYYWATWCYPCRNMTPLVDAIAADPGLGVTVARVNVDDEPELTAAQGVQYVPTLIAYSGGVEEGRNTGFRTDEHIRQFITALATLRPPAAP